MSLPTIRRAALVALILLLLPLRAAAAEVLVFAAASLRGALDEIAAEWEQETGQRAVLSYAGSPLLARQIAQGAPADLFLSASPEWMDAAEAADEIAPGTRRDLLGNRLALIGGAGAAPVSLEPGLDLAALLGEGRLAMALVDAVPAGVYGRAALDALGLWEAAAPRVAQVDNVRAALALVARGEAPYGIVYATDALAEPAVRAVAIFPEALHAPILYPAALTRQGAQSPAAAAFLDYLAGPKARAVWEGHGFRVIG